MTHHDPAANSFLNALVREFTQADWHAFDRNNAKIALWQGAFIYPLSGQQLWLAVHRYSHCGRHQFAGQFWLANQDGSHQSLDFEQLLAVLAAQPSLFQHAKLGLPQRQPLQQLLARAAQSYRAAKALAHSEVPAHFHQQASFIEHEQSLWFGHSIHPCPKALTPMTELERRQFGPDHGNSFPLHWFAVDRRQLRCFDSPAHNVQQLLAELILGDRQLQQWQQQLSEQQLLLPCHPWQAQVWCSDPQLAPLFANGKLISLGCAGAKWSATSSFRALYQPHCRWMLKGSLSIQLTNSLRHLQPSEMPRGQLLEQVLNSLAAQPLLQKFSQFSWLREPLSVVLCDEQGQALPQTVLVWRENPFIAQAAERVSVLATLLQDLPNQAVSKLGLLLRQQPAANAIGQQFFSHYLAAVVTPLLTAQADFGLLFGAHQQNLLLRLDEQGLPIAGYFRDCQGTGFTALAQQHFAAELQAADAHCGNVLVDDVGIYLFSYYLFINSTFNVIAALAQADLASEQQLLLQLRDYLLRFCEQPAMTSAGRDLRVVRYLLDSEQLWAKGNFVCNVHGINENTMADPFAIYHPITNPLRHIAKECAA